MKSRSGNDHSDPEPPPPHVPDGAPPPDPEGQTPLKVQSLQLNVGEVSGPGPTLTLQQEYLQWNKDAQARPMSSEDYLEDKVSSQLERALGKKELDLTMVITEIMAHLCDHCLSRHCTVGSWVTRLREGGCGEIGNEEGGLKARGCQPLVPPPAPTSRDLTGNSFRPLFLGESKTTGIVLCGAWI